MIIRVSFEQLESAVSEPQCITGLLVLGPGEVSVERRILLGGQLRQGRDHGIGRRSGEEDDGQPRLVGIGHGPVPDADQPSICQSLDGEHAA